MLCSLNFLLNLNIIYAIKTEAHLIMSSLPLPTVPIKANPTLNRDISNAEDVMVVKICPSL